jgi:serine/threonine protein phosphatase PrpC
MQYQQPNQSPPAVNFANGDEWLNSDPEKRDFCISNSFTLTQDKLDNNPKIDVIFSGTTCVMCFLSQNMLICANSGDSRAIMCSLINN